MRGDEYIKNKEGSEGDYCGIIYGTGSIVPRRD
jgi:hypothetical protein